MDFLDRVGSLVLGGMLLIVSIGGTYLFRLSWKRGRASVDWPATEGRVIWAGVVSDQDGHHVRVEYSYEVDGQVFESDAVSYRGIDTDRETAEQYVEKYPENRRLTVYYAPTNPQVSVLEAGVDSKTYLTGFAVFTMLFLLGIVLLLGLL